MNEFGISDLPTRLRILSDICREKGIARLSVGDIHLEMGSAPSPRATEPAPPILPLSRPVEPGDKSERIAKYRDAIENYHNTGLWPQPGDYGLTPEDVA